MISRKGNFSVLASLCFLAVISALVSYDARAAYDYGYAGTTHDERTDAFVASQGAGKRWWEHYNIGDTEVNSNLRQAMFSWLEGKLRNIPFAPSEKFAERFQGKSRDDLISGAIQHITGPGWWGGALPGANPTIRIFFQYYWDPARRVVTRQADIDALTAKMRDDLGRDPLSGTHSAALCGNNNWQWPKLVGAYLYNNIVESVGTMEYPAPLEGCPKSFSYNGRSYSAGGRYDVANLTRDRLEKLIDEALQDGSDEELSAADYFQYQMHAVALLVDFAPHEVIRRKAKMLMDFMVLNHAAGFSSGHLGGGHGRSYTNFEFGGQDSFPYGILFNYVPDYVSRSYVNTDLYVSGYRVPGHTLNFFESINGNTRWEGDDYFRIIRGRVGALGDRYDYITPNYSLGGAGFGTGWELNIGAGVKAGKYERFSVQPIKLFFCEKEDPDDTRACNSGPFHGSQRNLFSNGQSGWQHRNALFSKGTPYLHQIIEGNGWDAGPENVNGWTFYRKGKVAVAIKINDWHSSALEVATIGVDYPSFDAFKSAMGGARLTNSEFVTSKGVRIYEGYSDGARPFKRLEIFEGRGSGGEQKVVSWDSNVMKVSKGGTCTYNFNNWTYSGDCGEVRGDIPPPIVLSPGDNPEIPPTDQGGANQGGANQGGAKVIPGAKFKIGDRVRVTADFLLVRATPGGDVRTRKPFGTYGTIVGGPVFSDGLIWWEVKYDK